MNPRPRRRGYAMVAVVVFVMLFLGLWGLAARQIGSLLRIEQARANRVQADSKGLPRMRVLAKALAALEVAFPAKQYYQCKVQDAASDGTGSWFVVNFQLLPGVTATTSQWTIEVGAETDGSNPIPPTLGNFSQPGLPTS
jgi:Tfp pilus assembly protein PilV